MVSVHHLPCADTASGGRSVGSLPGPTVGSEGNETEQSLILNCVIPMLGSLSGLLLT